MLRLTTFRWEEMDRSAWDAFVTASPQGSAYMESWFLDAVLTDALVHVVEDARGWMAALLLPLGRRLKVLKGAFAPPFWRYGGVLWRSTDLPIRRRLTAAALLAEAAADIRRHFWTAHPAADCWLPFLQKDFSVSVRYSFQLPIRPWGEMLPTFQPRLRTTLRKPLPDGHRITSMPLDEAARLLRRVGPHSVGIHGRAFDMLWQIAEQGMKLHRADIWGYQTPSGWKGFILTIHDGHIVYQLMPVIDRSARLPVHEWLLRAVLQDGRRKGRRTFDFVGSHIPGVVSFIAKFAPIPVTYWLISKS